MSGATESGAKIALVAAMDRKLAIGRGGELPWHLPDDLRHFKQLTLEKPILMGRKTYESIGRPLPNRRNLVLTRDRDWSAPGVERVESFARALDVCAADTWLMVIGGGEIYALALPQARQLHLCEVDTEIADADTWFPDFDRSRWIECERAEHAADADHPYAFTQRLLERRST